MYNYKIDTKLLPNVFITWATTKGGAFNERIWLNCKTGKKKNKPEPWMHYSTEADMYPRWNTPRCVGLTYSTQYDPEIWVKSGTNVRYAYVKYHKDIDMLEVAAVGIDTTRKLEPHEWKYLGNRFFIDRQKNIFDQDGRMPSTYYLYEWHTAYNPNQLFSILGRLNHNKHVVNEFKKFIGNDYFTIGNGRCIEITNVFHIQEWYKTVQKVRSKGKEQKLADELTSIELGDITGLAEKYPAIDVRYSDYSHYTYTIKDIAYFETIDDDWCVIRVFQRNDKNQLSEPYRLYLNNNGKLRFVSYGPTGWIPAKISSFKYGSYNRLVNLDEASSKCNKIKYASAVLNDVEQCSFFDNLLTSLRFPEIEQFAKLGCDRIVKNMLGSSYPKADLKLWFGDYYNEKEKNMLRKIGMTKQQLDYYMTKWEDKGYYRSPANGLKEMRLVFGNDLSHLDLESYKKYLTGLIEITHAFWTPISDYAIRFDFDAEKFTKNLIRIGEKNNQIYATANDTLNMARSLNHGTMPEIDWYFEDYSDASRIHDALIEIKRRQDAERRALYDLQYAERMKKEEEKRIKVDKERKKYEYEDDNYVIRLPKDSNEIIREGTKQHICIGGYTTRHALGETNLFFLREKSNPDIPFYAIEMNHDNIIQIHGFGNRWLGNNPEAIPTVIRWLRKNNIKCNDSILTCTSTGYGSNHQYVKMPVVD